MNIPTILINSTINEFRAEGYELAGCSIDGNKYSDKEKQFITLSFTKDEEVQE